MDWFLYDNGLRHERVKSLQLIHAIPRPWKFDVLNDNCKNIIHLNHHIIKNKQILAIEKLIPKEL